MVSQLEKVSHVGFGFAGCRGEDGWLEGIGFLDYFVHGDPHMAFVVYAFPVADEQNLGAFVPYSEGVSYLVGNGAEAYEVKIVEINGIGWLVSFEPAFHEGACRAAGTVLKDQLRAVGRSLLDFIQLMLRL